MDAPKIGLNHSALPIVSRLIKNSSEYAVIVEKSELGTTIIDAGINTVGGFLTGGLVTEICLAGYGAEKILPMKYGKVVLPSILVQTDQPTLAILASQFAGWHIKTDGFSALASGPARALARKPKGLFEKIKYEEESEIAILVLETESKPPESVIEQIAAKCKVKPRNLFLIVFSTTSQTGATQVSGRVLETGLCKLMGLGLNPWTIKYAWGSAPIAPTHPELEVAMERVNSAVLLGGIANYDVCIEDDQKLEELVTIAPSSAPKTVQFSNTNTVQDSRRPSEEPSRFLEDFKKSGFDFFKIDPNLFAPSVVSVTSTRTGKIFRSGYVDADGLESALGLS